MGMNYPIILFLFFIFIINCFILNNGVLVADDIFFHFFENGIVPTKTFQYGTWALYLENILMYCIPNFFKLDFNEWALTLGTLLKSFVMTFIMYSYISFFQLRRINKTIFISSCCIIYSLLFIFFKGLNFPNLTIYTAFFRFTLTTSITIFFLYKLYEYLYKRQCKKSPLYILALIVATSSEQIFPILLACTFVLLLSYCIQKNKDKDTITFLALIFSILIVGSILLINTNGFQTNINFKIQDIHYSPYTLLISNFKEFSYVFYTKMIHNFIPYYLGIIVLIIFNFKNKSYTSIVFSISLILGNLAFTYSLILLGKTHYSGGYWIEHPDIYTILIPLFIVSFIVLFIDFIPTLQEKKQKVLTLLLISTFICISPILYKSIKTIKNTTNSIKIHSYMRDKIRLFYLYKNKTPIMPTFASSNSWFFLINEQETPFGKSKLTSSDMLYKTYYEWIEKDYFKSAYYIKNMETKEEDYIIVSDNDALKIFLENGGNCDELYSGKYNFSLLRNKNFILNKQ